MHTVQQLGRHEAVSAGLELVESRGRGRTWLTGVNSGSCASLVTWLTMRIPPYSSRPYIQGLRLDETPATPSSTNLSTAPLKKNGDARPALLWRERLPRNGMYPGLLTSKFTARR